MVGGEIPCHIAVKYAVAIGCCLVLTPHLLYHGTTLVQRYLMSDTASFIVCASGGLTLLNFVSNHDVIRLASVLTKQEHYTLAIAMLLLLPGIPCFYYGDEFGVEVRRSAVQSSAWGAVLIVGCCCLHSRGQAWQRGCLGQA